jgi:hypothetical protein
VHYCRSSRWVLLLCVASALASGAQENTTHVEVLWGKTVLKKRLEHITRLGNGFKFRSVSYYIDCSAGCFENPWHIGEFWFHSQMLTRGIQKTDVSVSPSKRYALFADREARKLKLFDTSRKETLEAAGLLAGDVKQFTWSESQHKVTAEYYEGHQAVEIKLPE